MNCKKVRNKISDYIDGKLPEEQNHQFIEHIQNCNECAAMIENLKSTLSYINKNERVLEQPYYYSLLKQRMENRYEEQKSFIHILLTKKIVQPAIYLASLIIAVYIGILIGSSATSSSQYSDSVKSDTSYINTYAQYQYINDLNIESIETNLISEQTEPETNTDKNDLYN